MQLGPSRTAMIVVQPRCGVRSAALTTSPQAVMPAYLLSSTGSSQAMVHVMAPLDTVTPEGIKYTFTLRSSALEFTPGLLLVLPQETLFPRDILLHQCHRMLRLPSIAACCMEFGTLEVGSMQDEVLQFRQLHSCTGTALAKATALLRLLRFIRCSMGSRQLGGTASPRPSPSRIRATKNSSLHSVRPFLRLPSGSFCPDSSSSMSSPACASRSSGLHLFFLSPHNARARLTLASVTQHLGSTLSRTAHREPVDGRASRSIGIDRTSDPIL